MALYACETCEGSGTAGQDPCTDCYGTGEVPHGSDGQAFAESRDEWIAKYRQEDAK